MYEYERETEGLLKLSRDFGDRPDDKVRSAWLVNQMSNYLGQIPQQRHALLIIDLLHMIGELKSQVTNLQMPRMD